MTRLNEAKTLLKVLEDNNKTAYIVGGCVRDMLLNVDINDIDICTSATPNEMKIIFKDYFIVETGLKHGTITIILNGNNYDITTYRIEDGYNDYRHPDKVTFVSNISEDLSRRDFTINAIAQDSKDNIFDPFNGQKDLKDKIIRAVGNPIERFTEDPLRMLRAIRFSAKLNFDIESETLKAITESAELINKISKERIRDELIKILIYDPSKIEVLYETHLLEEIIPEVTALYKIKQHNKWHYTDAMHHTFDALKYSKKFDYLSNTKKLYIRMALLLHDTGKFDTESIDKDGYNHYYNHPEFSYQKALTILKRLKFSNYEIELISKLVRYHDGTIYPSRKVLKTFITDYNFSLYEFKLLGYLKECDLAAHVHQENDQRMTQYFKLLSMYKQKVKTDNVLSMNDIDITGDDIMKILNISPSPEVGEIKKELFNLVFYKPSLNKKYILEKIIKDKYLK